MKRKKGSRCCTPPSEAARITASSSLSSVKCIRSTPEYFAERLFKAMKVRGGVDANRLGEGVPAYHCWDFRTSPRGPLAKESLQWISHRAKCWHFVPGDLQSLLPGHVSHDRSEAEVSACTQSIQANGLEAHTFKNR